MCLWMERKSTSFQCIETHIKEQRRAGVFKGVFRRATMVAGWNQTKDIVVMWYTRPVHSYCFIHFVSYCIPWDYPVSYKLHLYAANLFSRLRFDGKYNCYQCLLAMFSSEGRITLLYGNQVVGRWSGWMVGGQSARHRRQRFIS